MRAKILTRETNQNTYHIIKVSKMTYEQQQERKEEILYMTLQKSIGAILTIISVVMILNGLAPAILTLLMGLATMLTKDHVIII